MNVVETGELVTVIPERSFILCIIHEKIVDCYTLCLPLEYFSYVIITIIILIITLCTEFINDFARGKVTCPVLYTYI